MKKIFKKIFNKNLIVGIIIVVAVFLTSEMFIRIFLGVHPLMERFRLHSCLGWEWTPGYMSKETIEGTDYEMVVSSQGLRNEEISVPKPFGTYRIIALGDSITEGPGVKLEHTFVKLLEKMLRDVYSKHTIEVINAGIGSYGVVQERIWLETLGFDFEPNLVILNVYLNDSKSFESLPTPIVALRNFFSKYSASYVIFQNVVRSILVAQHQASDDFPYRYKDDWKSSEWISDSDTLTRMIQEADNDWGLAWVDSELAIIKNELIKMSQIVRDYGAEILIVIFPVDIQVYSLVNTPLGLYRPQQFLIGVAHDINVPALDLLPYFRSLKRNDLFYDQCHLKPYAHQVVATAIYEMIKNEKIIMLP